VPTMEQRHSRRADRLSGGDHGPQSQPLRPSRAPETELTPDRRTTARLIAVLTLLTAALAGAPTGLARQPAGAAEAALTPRKILAVKISNTRVGDFPQVGLPNADLVYTELVEGGQTRHIGLFSSQVPPKVQPVRSLRETDLELLPQFGKIGIAFSGHASEMKQLADSSGQVLFSEQLRSPEIYRDLTRCASSGALSCVTVKTPAAMARLTGTGGRSVVLSRAGLPAGSVPSAAVYSGRALSNATLHFPAKMAVTWDGVNRRYTVRTGSLPSTGLKWNAVTRRWSKVPLTAGSVVIQSVSTTKVRDSYLCRPDWMGGSDPVYRSNSVGSGDALLLRGGKVYRLRWSRSSTAGVTTFRHAVAGSPRVRIAGRPWVFLFPESGRAYLAGNPWYPSAPLPRPAAPTATPSDECPHRVLMTPSLVKTPEGSRVVVRLRDEQLSLRGTPVVGATVRIVDRFGVVHPPAVTNAGGRIVVPAAALSTGWARVTLPKSPEYRGSSVTVLRGMTSGTGVVTGNSSSYTIGISAPSQLNGSVRMVRFFGRVLNAHGTVAFTVERRPAVAGSSWTRVTHPAASVPAPRGGAGSLVDANVALPATKAYYLRIVMRDAAGHVAKSQTVRIGPAPRTMSWSFSPALRVGQKVAIKAPVVSPPGPVTYTSLTTSTCTVSRTSPRYVVGRAAGTCTLRASVAGTAYVLPASRKASFAVTR